LKTIDALAEGRLRAEQVGLPELAALYSKLADGNGRELPDA
jgi:hypothetical protein